MPDHTQQQLSRIKSGSWGCALQSDPHLLDPRVGPPLFTDAMSVSRSARREWRSCATVNKTTQTRFPVPWVFLPRWRQQRQRAAPLLYATLRRLPPSLADDGDRHIQTLVELLSLSLSRVSCFGLIPMSAARGGHSPPSRRRRSRRHGEPEPATVLLIKWV